VDHNVHGFQVRGGGAAGLHEQAGDGANIPKALCRGLRKELLGFLLCGLSRGQHFRAILTRLAWQCPHQHVCVVGASRGRYTGPYYLAMVVPVLVLASAGVSASFYALIVLGVVIVAGSGIIW
jgi:hypothetical protein